MSPGIIWEPLGDSLQQALLPSPNKLQVMINSDRHVGQRSTSLVRYLPCVDRDPASLQGPALSHYLLGTCSSYVYTAV